MKFEPIVTLIMPVRNEARFIDCSLSAIAKQDYPLDLLEVIIADGMSDDGTREKIIDFKSNNPAIKIKLINNHARFFSNGFNLGLNLACGDIIVMLGGHAELAPDYIRQCVEYLNNDENIDCVGGPIETIAETSTAKSIALAMSSPFGVGGVLFRTGSSQSEEVDTVAFGAYRRSAIEKCGMLDEEMTKNQDDEYNYRLRKLGGKIILDPYIRSRYYSRNSLKSLWRQYFWYGYYKVRVLQKHPRQMKSRHFIPPIFVAFLVTTVILSLLNGWGMAFLGLVAGSYILANILTSIITANKRGWRHLYMLPVVFATLHLSYGSGFLVGLVRFAHRWRDKGTHHRDTEFAEK